MAMAKFTVDTANKLFVAKAGVTSIDAKVDLYSDAKEHWLTDFPPFDFPFGGSGAAGSRVGGEDIDALAGTSVPLYLFLRDGWRIRPQEANHTLTVTDAILLVDGGGDPFVDTLGAFTVRINYQQPVQAIVVTPALATMATQIQELFQNMGLDSTKPLVITAASRSSTGVDLTIVEAPAGTVTVTRQ